MEFQGIDLSLVVNISSWYASVEASLLGPYKFEVGETSIELSKIESMKPFRIFLREFDANLLFRINSDEFDQICT